MFRTSPSRLFSQVAPQSHAARGLAFSFRQFGRRTFRAIKCQTPLHPVFIASNALLYTIRSEKRPFVPYLMSVERCSTRSPTLRLFHPAVLRIFSGRGWSGSRRFGSVLWTD